jgi:drug/metabolite transporter (DMT)-like permease
MASPVRSENRLRGIFWMLATMMCFIGLDAIMKLGLERYSLVQVTWARFFFATVFAVLWCGTALPRLLKTTSPGKQTVRSVFLMVTTLLFNGGIMFVPLATATTIMFLTPIITTVLSVLVLSETVGIRRWAAILVGFAGAMVVVQPWRFLTDSLNIGVVLLVAATVSNASYQIATRQVRGDDPKTSLLFTAAFGAVVSSAILPWYWTSPDAWGWLLLVGSGLAGMLGHLCIIEAFRNAPASVVAPFSYSALIWATLLGYLVWSEFPANNVWAGAVLIIGSGLYILWRETLLRQHKAAAPG